MPTGRKINQRNRALRKSSVCFHDCFFRLSCHFLHRVGRCNHLQDHDTVKLLKIGKPIIIDERF